MMGRLSIWRADTTPCVADKATPTRLSLSASSAMSNDRLPVTVTSAESDRLSVTLTTVVAPSAICRPDLRKRLKLGRDTSMTNVPALSPSKR